VPFLLGLVGISVVSALIAARITFGLDGWLWNLDLPKIHYPLAALYHGALADGRLPIWSDNLGLGFPLYAEGQIGAFYPINWLIFQLEPLMAMDVSRLFHLAMTGVGTGLLALRLSGSRAGALLAAGAIILCGATITKLEWWNMTAAFAWAPWVLLPLAARRAPRRGELVAAGVLWGVQALTGHPQTWMLTGVVALILLVRRPWPPAIGRMVGFGALGVAVGAAQLLPTYLLLGLSDRAGGLPPNELFGNATTVFDVLGVGFANAFTLTTDGAWDYITNWYPDGQFTLLNAGFYLGLPLLALAGVGASARRSRRWLAVAGVMLLIPILAAFKPDIWSHLPILNGLRSPVRAYMFVSLALVLIAAVGVARLSWTRPPPFRWAFVAVTVVVIAYLGAVILAAWVPAAFDQLTLMSWWQINPDQLDDVREKALAALSAPWPFLFEIALVLVLAVILTRPLSRMTRAVAVGVAILPLVLFGPAPNPTGPTDTIAFGDSSFVSAMRAQGAHRLMTFGASSWYPGMPDQMAAGGVPDLLMFSSLNIKVVDDVVAAIRAEDAGGPLRRAVGLDRIVTFGARCTGPLLGREETQDAYVCGVEGTLSPPYWVPEEAASPVRGPADPHPAAAVDLELALANAEPTRTIERSPGRHELTVVAPSDGWVYFDSGWWPSWEVEVDGIPVAQHEALGGRLVPVPSGTHTLVSQLTLREVTGGAAAGVIAVAAGVAWALLPRRRQTVKAVTDGRSA
jgi:hypothetical protein